MKKAPKTYLIWLVVCFLVQGVISNVPMVPNPVKSNPKLAEMNSAFTAELQSKPLLSQFDLWRINYAPRGKQVAAGLSPDQMLFAFAGMREMIASILWVRADSFFDQGNYDAILPIIRIVTWLDPKQIDVYSTGMWHIGYNFTDEENRSDRRYIPVALALGKEGAANNPETYELFFETGWMFYHKVNDDYDRAVYWFEQAQKRADILPARRNILGMAYQRDGKIEQGLALYYDQLDRAEIQFRKTQDFSDHQQRDTVESNIDTMLVRMAQRGYLGKKAGITPVVPYDIDPPFDVGFSVEVSVPSPRILRVRATWKVRPVGTRIRVILRDADYPNAVPAGMKWDFTDNVSFEQPKDQTFMQDELFIRNQKADKRMDLSRDPTMYSFTKDNYVMEFYYNPRNAPPHIQDKFSWNGEGMTDKRFLNTEIRPGTRVIFTQLKLTRDMIDRQGEWLDKVPVIKTENYVEPGSKRQYEPDVIHVPGLRG